MLFVLTPLGDHLNCTAKNIATLMFCIYHSLTSQLSSYDQTFEKVCDQTLEKVCDITTKFVVYNLMADLHCQTRIWTRAQIPNPMAT